MIEYLKTKFPDLKYNPEYNGIDTYESILYEYNAFKSSAVVYYANNFPIFSVENSDALLFLNKLCTTDLKALEVDKTQTTLLLNDKGGFIDQVQIYNFSEFLFLIGSPTNDERISRWINRFILNEKVNLNIVKDKYSYFRIFGKKVDPFITLIFGKEITDLRPNYINNYSDEIECKIIKTKIFKYFNCYDVIIKNECLSEFLLRVNNNLNMFDCTFVGNKVYDLLRIENGICQYPNEMNIETNPNELLMTDLINFSKDHFIGQEFISRQESYQKIKYQLKGVIFSENIEINIPIEIFCSRKIVGKITSIVFSPSLSKKIGLCLIIKEYLKDLKSDNFYVISKNKNYSITITDLPIKNYENLY